MTPTTFRQLLAVDSNVVGTWLKLSAVESVELMSLAGFDFVVLDLEHSPMSLESASTLIAVARGTGVVPLVRTPDHSSSWIQRCLDAGAAGVLIPHVDTVEEASAVLKAARHEPTGRRGVGPTSRAGSWGMVPTAEYFARAAEAVVIAQLESPTAIANAAELANSGVDALFVGPADLSVAMGVPLAHDSVRAAMLEALAEAQAAGIPCGTAVGDPNEARELAEAGFRFVMISNDATILGSGARQIINIFNSTLQ